MPIEKIPPIPPLGDSKNKNKKRDNTNKGNPKGDFQEILDKKMGKSDSVIETKESLDVQPEIKIGDGFTKIKPDLKKDSFTGMIKKILEEGKE